MTRAQLEHLIRASATIADDDELIIIESQSVLGQYPDAPAELRASMEADLFPKNHPERWDLIDGSIGEGSMFQQTFGYFAQGVDETTATLPEGWRERLVAIRTPATRGATGWALEIHDLLISKYVANRPKDRDFIRAAIAHRLAGRGELDARLRKTELTQELRTRIEGQIERDFALGA